MNVNANLYPTTEELPEGDLTYLSQVLYPESFEGSNRTLSSENDAKEKTLELYSELSEVVHDMTRQKLAKDLEAKASEMLKLALNAQHAKTVSEAENEFTELRAMLNDLVDDVLWPADD